MQLRSVLFLGLALCAAAQYDDATKSYAERAEEWKKMNTKDQFVRSFNKETGHNVKGKRADRLYNHVISLLDHKGAQLTDNGIKYYLPITHHFTFLPDQVAEGIEFISLLGRKVYYGTLEFIHEEAIEIHHKYLDHFLESGAAKVVSFCCGSYIAVAALSWLVNRFTDGVSPTQRKLNKDTRRRAQEYLARKREL